ncbi:MAG: PorV/PorQ family protein [Elusimicrobiota bacterium]
MKIFLLMMTIASSGWGLGVSDKGSTGAQFLKLGPGARAAAMGEACSAVCEDAYAVYYNPAGLGHIRQSQAAAMHNRHFQGIVHNFGALAVPLLAWTDSKLDRDAYGTLAFSLTSLGVEGIERRGTVETDAPTGTFGASDLAYSLGYGISMDRRLAFGGALKFIEQTLDSSRASAYAADIGTLYRGERVSFSGGVRNFGTRVKFRQESDPLPLMIYAGTGWRAGEGLLLSADLRLPRDNAPALSAGAELKRSVGEGLFGALRAGFNSANMDAGGFGGVSFGAGVQLHSLEMDFAWIPRGDLGDTYRYSLQIKF